MPSVQSLISLASLASRAAAHNHGIGNEEFEETYQCKVDCETPVACYDGKVEKGHLQPVTPNLKCTCDVCPDGHKNAEECNQMCFNHFDRKICSVTDHSDDSIDSSTKPYTLSKVFYKKMSKKTKTSICQCQHCPGDDDKEDDEYQLAISHNAPFLKDETMSAEDKCEANCRASYKHLVDDAIFEKLTCSEAGKDKSLQLFSYEADAKDGDRKCTCASWVDNNVNKVEPLLKMIDLSENGNESDDQCIAVCESYAAVEEVDCGEDADGNEIQSEIWYNGVNAKKNVLQGTRHRKLKGKGSKNTRPCQCQVCPSSTDGTRKLRN